MKFKLKSLLIMLGLTPGLSNTQTIIEAPKIEPPVMGVTGISPEFAAGNSGRAGPLPNRPDVNRSSDLNQAKDVYRKGAGPGSQYSDQNIKVDPPKLKEKF